MDLSHYIRNIPDFPKPGIQFKDITPLLADSKAFQECIEIFYQQYRGKKIQAVAAAEARGFLFAAPLALKMNLPLVPLRKPGKLPFHTHTLHYDLEYGSAALQVHIDGFQPNARVLILDDLLATGGTLQAGCQLIEKAGAKVAGCAVLVELTFLKGREKLAPHEVYSVIQF
jgi:adenine phosphoribosyltransferase